MQKPRLAENEADLWQAFFDLTKKYRCYGSIVLDTLGEGCYSLNVQNKFEKLGEVADKSMYWGYLPLTIKPTKQDISNLDWAIAHDTCEVWFQPYSHYQDAKLLHSPAGLSWRTKNDREFSNSN